MAKVITFGELMLRLQPYNYERFVQCDHVEFTFGGGEANVAVSLANYGMDVAYVTKLPAHAIGQAAVNSLRRYGVDTTKIVRGGDRVGIYFNEKGASQRGSVCIYDRANSAIAKASREDFDWDSIFEGVEWFHFTGITGITPALGANVVDICRDACKAAKARGIKISCDLNYRGKLWTRAEAREAMTELCQYVDVCISNEEDAKDVFGIEAEATDIYGGKLNHDGYKSVAKQLADKFGFEYVAITLRESRSAFDNGWSAMLYNVADDEYCFSKKYDLHIIDRVGGGDSFGGGLIYALMNGKSAQGAVEFAVAHYQILQKTVFVAIIDLISVGMEIAGSADFVQQKFLVQKFGESAASPRIDGDGADHIFSNFQPVTQVFFDDFSAITVYCHAADSAVGFQRSVRRYIGRSYAAAQTGYEFALYQKISRLVAAAFHTRRSFLQKEKLTS